MCIRDSHYDVFCLIEVVVDEDSISVRAYIENYYFVNGWSFLTLYLFTNLKQKIDFFFLEIARKYQM